MMKVVRQYKGALLFQSEHVFYKHAFYSIILLCLCAIGEVKAATTDSLWLVPKAQRPAILFGYWEHNSWDRSPDSAQVYKALGDIKIKAAELGDDKTLAYAEYFLLSYKLSLRIHNVEDDIARYEKCKEWARENRYNDIAAICENALGYCYFYNAEYDKAYPYLISAYNSFKEIGFENIPGCIGLLSGQGDIYYRSYNYDLCISTLNSALKCPVNTYTLKYKMKVYNTLGLTYLKLKQYPKGISYFEAALPLTVKSTKDSFWYGNIIGNIGQAYYKMGKLDSALTHFKIDLRLSLKYNEQASALKDYVYLADIALTHKSPAQAYTYLVNGHTALLKYLKIQSFYGKERSYDQYNIYYHEMGVYYMYIKDFHTSSLYLDSLSTVKDSIAVASNASLVLLGKVNEKTAMEKHRSEIQILEKKRQTETLIFITGIICVILISCIIILVYRSNRLKAKKEKELIEQQKIMLEQQNMQAQKDLEYAQDQLTEYVNNIKEKNELIDRINKEMETVEINKFNPEAALTFEQNMHKLVNATILSEEDWLKFKTIYERVNRGFFERLKNKHDDLSPSEIRLLALIKLNLSTREMASMLGISIDGVRKTRHRIRKKLSLNSDDDIEQFVSAI